MVLAACVEQEGHPAIDSGDRSCRPQDFLEAEVEVEAGAQNGSGDEVRVAAASR